MPLPAVNQVRGFRGRARAHCYHWMRRKVRAFRGSPKPLRSTVQVPFHIYNAAAQLPLLAWCKAHDIVVLSYSPLGIPVRGVGGGMPPQQLAG